MAIVIAEREFSLRRQEKPQPTPLRSNSGLLTLDAPAEISSSNAWLKEIGERIREKRKELGLFQTDLVGTRNTVLSRVEHGVEKPYPKLLKDVALGLGVSEDWILNGDGEPRRDTTVKPKKVKKERRKRRALGQRMSTKAMEKPLEEPKVVFVPQRFPDPITTIIRGAREITIFSGPRQPVDIQEVVSLGRKCEPFLIAMKDDKAIERELGNSNGIKVTLLSMSNGANGQPCLEVESPEGKRILDLSDAIRIYGYEALISFFENPPVWKPPAIIIKTETRKRRRLKK